MIVPKVGDIYRHHKGGTYVVLDLVHNSTNGADEAPDERVVIYMSLDPGPNQGNKHARELWEWAEYATWAEGIGTPRFQLVSRKS